jgi:hypothetical protein
MILAAQATSVLAADPVSVTVGGQTYQFSGKPMVVGVPVTILDTGPRRLGVRAVGMAVTTRPE